MENSLEDFGGLSNSIRVSSTEPLKRDSFEKHPEKIKENLGISKKTSGRYISQRSPDLKLSKNSILSPSHKQKINTLSQKTSDQIIKSVYHFIKSKTSLTLKKELSGKDQKEIQAFFAKKKNEFTNTLLEIYSNKKTTPSKHLKNQEKVEEKLEREIEKELLSLKQRKKLVKREIIKKASEKFLREKDVARKKVKIELRKKEIEEKKTQEFEKDIIKKNIEKFYQDRISMLKESVKKDIETQKVLDYEKKMHASAIIKEKKKKKLELIIELKNRYEIEIEDMKEKINQCKTFR